MEKKRHHSSATKKLKKKQKELIVDPEETTSELMIEEILTLSNRDYRLYYIISAKKTVGYFGVYLNGNFNYSIIKKGTDEHRILIFIKTFIREELKLIPVVNPKLYKA